MLSPDQPRYVRITDFGEDGINPSHEYVTAEPIEWECELFRDDILFARSGATVGKTYLHEDTSRRAIFAGYCIRFRFAPALALPRFIYFFTKTEAYNRWVAAIQRPSGQPNINKEEFKSLEVPVPPISMQRKLIKAMDGARATRRAKLEKADALLAGMDAFLLDILKLEPVPKEQRKTFAVPVRLPRSQDRLNADYFHPERLLTLRMLTKAAKHLDCWPLTAVVTFERDQIKTPGPNYVGLAHIQSGTGEIIEANDEATGACSSYKKDDVLFARLRPYLNKVWCADRDGCCSPEFHVLRVRDDVDILPEYLAVILRSQITLAQTIHMMTGNTHPRLNNDDVVNLVIPIPSGKVQQDIAREMKKRQDESRRLRAEAEAEWQAAKKWFEEQLLGKGG
jgi:restriction endonuclease S subunit